MKTLRIIKPFAAVAGCFCFALNIMAQQAPVITTQPASMQVYETQPAVFSVVATGAEPLTYQWFFNGVEIDYATNSSYSITVCRPVNAGDYFVVVANGYGRATSQVATLSVTPIPNCQPQSYGFGTVVLSTRYIAGGINAKVYDSDGTTPLAGVGYSAQLYGGPAGTPEDQLQPACPMTVFRTGTAAGYVLQTDVYIPGVMPGENATLQLRVWDNQNTTIQSYEAALVARVKTGKSALITINDLGGDPGTGIPPIFPPYLTNIQSFIIGTAPAISVQPQSQVVAPGSQVVLSVAATGAPEPTYQWRKNGVELQGANSATLLIPSFQTENAGAYDVVISNPFGSVTSQVATLSLLVPPSIEQGLANIIVDEGADVQFEVIATGAQPLSYFWYKDNVIIGGATSPSLQLQAVQEPAQGIYKIVVSNAAGIAQSSATLTVNQRPVAHPASVSLYQNSSKPVVLTAEDADGDSLTFAIATPPQHGSLAGDPPNLTYTPQTDYTGADSFTFTVNDGRLTSLPATISININEIAQNKPPVAQNLTVTNGEDMQLIVQLPASDPNDDPLTFFIVSMPTNGVATLLSNNVVLYQPDTNFVGVDAFTFAAADSEFTSEVAVVSIVITNVYDPISTVQLAQSTVEDSQTALNFDLTSAVVNPDGLPLSFSLPNEKSLRGGQISIVNNHLQYLPPQNFNGMDVIQYTVSDGVTTITGQLLVNVQYINDVRPYTFNQAVNYQTGGTNPIAIAVADYKKDTKLDIAVVNQGEQGEGGNVAMLIGDGKGNFALDTNNLPVAIAGTPIAAVSGDFNKDLTMDIAVLTAEGQVVVLYGNNGGTFSSSNVVAVGGSPTSLTAADFDKDLRLDLAVGDASGVVKILLNKASGWIAGADVTVGGVVSAVGAGDLFKTLKQGLVVADSVGNKVWLIPGDGKGGFSNAVAVAYDVGESPVAVAVGDVNNDKLLDVLVVNGGSDDITVLTNKGKGVMEAAGTFGIGESIGAMARGVVLGDFNRDKNLDVAVTLAGFGAVEVMLGNGDGTFGFYWGDPASMYMVGEAPIGIASGDLNKDMSVDLVVANYGSGDVSVLLNNYAPMAYKQSVIAREDTPIDITLQGTEGPLDYIIVRGPTNGTITADYIITNSSGVVVATNSLVGPVLHYTPKADAFGNDVIDYYVNDGVKTSKLARVAIKILPVNDQPSFDLASDMVVVNEDSGAQKIEGFARNIVKGPANESMQAVKFSVSIEPPEKAMMFAGVKWATNRANPNGAYLGYGMPKIDSKGVLSFTPLKNAYGECVVNVQMMDSGGTANGGTNLSDVKTFELKVMNVNDAPVIGRVAGQTILEDSNAVFIVNVKDLESRPEDLVLSVTSTNQALLPDANITVSMGDYPTQRVVRVVPVADMNGATLLTFTVSDGTNSASTTASLRVTAVNDAPRFELNPDYAVINAVVGQAFSANVMRVLNAGPADEVKQLLTFTIANSNPGIFITQPKIDKTGLLTFKAKSAGTAVLTIGLKDGGGNMNGGVSDSPDTATITINVQ